MAYGLKCLAPGPSKVSVRLCLFVFYGRDTAFTVSLPIQKD